jgi:hypothetical protein
MGKKPNVRESTDLEIKFVKGKLFYKTMTA